MKRKIQDFIQELSLQSDPCVEGVQRLSYTEAYKRGVGLVSKRMKDLGLRVYEDPVGNIIGFMPGKNPALPMILSGSHLDTVRCAGAYDGAAGIACALAVAQMIKESRKPLQRTYAVLGTVEEEGSRFGQILLGSQFLMGVFGDDQLTDFIDQETGQSLKEVLQKYGAVGELKGKQLIRKENIRAFLELHGEQGPVLENAGISAGIVKNIAGIRWLEVTILGKAGHSGTIPMGERHDAGIGAYTVLLLLNQRVTEQYRERAVITAGQIKLDPGSANCVPGKCTFSLDIRSGEEQVLEEIEAMVLSMEGIIQEMGLNMEIKRLSRREPVPMDPLLQRYFAEGCEKEGVTYLWMNSGAGHDSMVFARYVPTAMLFMPNRGGISHHPDEYIDEKYLRKGAKILYDVIQMLDHEEM